MTISVSRPASSAAFIRFTGTLDVAPDANADYGQLPGPFAAGTYPVRFVLGLAGSYVQPPGSTGIRDLNYCLSPTVYRGRSSAVPLKSSFWAQNTVVIVKALDANLTNCELDAIEWESDPQTGQPVVVLDMTVQDGPPTVDIQIEVKHSTGR